MIRAFTRYIEDNTALVIGTDLYAGFRPHEAPDACDVVLDRVPRAPVWNRESRFRISIQVLSRDTSYFTAETRAHTITTLFNGKTGLILYDETGAPQYRLDTCLARGPASIGQDEQRRHEFTTNFDCWVSSM
jgi:hypothetical protein